MAQAYVAQLKWFSGDTAEAIALAESAVAWAREVGHVPSLGLGLMYACLVYQWEGNRPAVADRASEILSLSAKYGLPAYEGYAAMLFDWANGEVERSRAVLGGLSHIGCRLALTYFSSLAPDNQFARGELDAAIDGVDQALSLCRDNDEHFFEAELHRRRAMYEVRRNPASESVRRSLEQAAALAARCDMPRIEVLATLELTERFGGTAEQRARIAELLKLHPALQQIMPTPGAGESR
jgi:predicted ATPase